MTNGRMGAVPDYYALVQSARYLGVAPWELAEQPSYWVQIAQVCEGAEIDARNEQQRRNAKRQQQR